MASPLAAFAPSRPASVARWVKERGDLREIEDAYRALEWGCARSLEGPEVDDDEAPVRVVAIRTLLRHVPGLDRGLVRAVIDRDIGQAHRFLENEELGEADHEVLFGVVLDRIASCTPEDWNRAPHGGLAEAEFGFLDAARERLGRLPEAVLDRAEALLTGGLQGAIARDRREAGLWRAVLEPHSLREKRIVRLVRWAADRNRPFFQAAFLAHPDHPVDRTLAGLRSGLVGVATVAHGIDRWLEQDRYGENPEVRTALLGRLEAGLEGAVAPTRLVRAALIQLLGHAKESAELVRTLALLARVDGGRAATAVERELRHPDPRLAGEDIVRVLGATEDGVARGRLIAALGRVPADPSRDGSAGASARRPPGRSLPRTW